MLDYPLDLLARVLGARVESGGDRVARRMCTDSRSVQAGDLFFAITGEKFDGHQFVKEALEKGAVGAVVNTERLPKNAAKAGPLIRVPDPLLALGTLGGWHRDRFNVRMVAVTGSVGKTTTKDLVHGVLSTAFTTLKSPGNLNAEIGLPLTLFELGPKHEAAVVEMAMRGPGQIRYLTQIARPEVAVITNIGLSHMELLGSQQAIAEAKAEVLDYLPHGGAAVLNSDDPYYSFLKSRVPPHTQVVSFGLERGGRETVGGMYLGPGARSGEGGGLMGTRFMLRGPGQRNVRPVWVPLLGRHNMRNALAAAGAGQAMGVSWPRVCRGLGEADISAMRMAVHRLRDGSLLLDDAYNASSPEAMFGALEVLRELPGLRKIAVLGSMLELGKASEQAHRSVGEVVAEVAPTVLITVGDQAALIAENATAAGLPEDRVEVCDSNEKALSVLSARRRAGDIILVKGSRGMAMEGIVQEIGRNGAG